MRKLYVVPLTILIVLTLALPGSTVPSGRVLAQDVGTRGQPGGPALTGGSEERRSGSPYLQLPEQLRNVPPVPAPEPRIVEGAPQRAGAVGFDLVTQTETSLPDTDLPVISQAESLASSPAFGGLPEAGAVVPDSVFPPDGRARVTPTTSHPFQSVVKLVVTFGDGFQGTCSGAIVGCEDDGHGYHVLTAAHCVYSHDHGGWPGWAVQVFPALDGTYMPFHYAWGTYVRVYGNWISYGDMRDDWAILTLDRNVGDYTGWMGRKTAAYDDPIYTGRLYTAGYPCNAASAQCPSPVSPENSMWWDLDYGRAADEYYHWYLMDTMPGQDGSPVWYTVGTTPYIVGVHTRDNDGSGSNRGTRLNTNKLASIEAWCLEDTPPANDRADLVDDGQSNSYFTPVEVRPSVTNFVASSDVRNIGTASSGPFKVAYYASGDTTIAMTDHKIGEASTASISPFQWGHSNLILTFPTTVPDGLYYVGWIIDSGGAVTELDEGNNTAYKTGYRLLVDRTPPSNPTSVNSTSHTAGAWSADSTVDVTWSGASDGSGSGIQGYSVEWSESPTTVPDANVDVTSANATSPALGSGQWYVHVRAVDDLGNWNAGAKHHGPFKIDVAPPSDPTTVTSSSHAPGVASTDPTVDVSWSGAADGGGSGVQGYSVEWSTSPATVPDMFMDTTEMNATSPTLDGGNDWYVRIRTVDHAGNWSAGAAHHGPFNIEHALYLPLLGE